MDDLAYLRGRAREEHVAALRSRDERVRMVHLRMAQLYRRQIRALTIARLRSMLPTQGRAERPSGLHKNLVGDAVEV